MLGAIAGDIVGSVLEGGQCNRDALELFGFGACFTDDSVCTVAIAEALMDALACGGVDQADYATSLRRWVGANPGRGYGGMFVDWAHSTKGPYNSFGNGGAMRVAAVGFLASSFEEALSWADASASVTHNHLEGMRGARAIAAAIWLARQGLPPAEIERRVVALTGCDSPRTVAYHAQTFGFTTRADETVPMALACALEAQSWSEAVKNAAHIGGDTDTIACMAGAIAEARFGLPRNYAVAAMEHLTPEMAGVVERFYAFTGRVLPTSEANDVAEPPLRGPFLYEQESGPVAPDSLLRRVLTWLNAH
jgi:ADP-ribosyl-[dinitrogen reductase] hydrolase